MRFKEFSCALLEDSAKFKNVTKAEYEDSAEFTDDFSDVYSSIKDIQKLVTSKKWQAWMKITDTNFMTGCKDVNDDLVSAMNEAVKAIEALDKELQQAE